MQNIIQFHPTPRDEFGRVAPHDMNLERAILCAAMASEESAATLFSKISNPELFYRPKHQAIFRIIQDQFRQGDPIDPVSVSTRVNSPASTITPEEVMGLDQGDGLVYAASLDHHILILQQLYILRSLITSMGKNITRAYDPTTDPIKCLADIDSHIQSLFEEVTRGAAGALSLKEEAKKYVVNLARSEYQSGVPSGFDDLDKQTNGWQRGDLIVLAARPGEGKTSLALAFALNAMVPTLFFSLEMSGQQLTARALSMLSGIGLSDIPKINDQDDRWQTLAHTAENIDMLFTDECSGGLTLQEFRARSLRAKSKHRIGLIVVDYLQLLTVVEKGLPREQQVAQITRTLKGVAKEMNVPVIALSQLNRAVEERSGPPRLSNLRESGAIEQDADLVLFLHKEPCVSGREGYDFAQQCEPIGLHIAKHRNGPTGICHLLFDKKKTLFKPFTDRI